MPVMRMGLKAVGMMNGVAGLTKMIGVPYPSSGVSAVLSKAGSLVDSLDKESTVAEFDVLQGVIDEEVEKKRGAELRKLTDFFEKYDVDREYDGMQGGVERMAARCGLRLKAQS